MQYLATIIAWKNAVSEHLEWLKFQKLSGGSACESLRGGGGGGGGGGGEERERGGTRGYSAHLTSQLYWTLPTKV